MRSLVLALLALALSACGASDDGGDEPGKGADGSADAPCGVVSDASITESAEREMRVTGPEQVGQEQKCSARPTAEDDPLRLTWTVAEATEPLQTTVGFESGVYGPATTFDLPRGIEAARMSGVVFDTPTALVMAVVDDRLIRVEATVISFEADQSDLTLDDLAQVATDVAAQYAEHS